MHCRICESDTVAKVGDYKPYLDYTCTVYECMSCGCRFVNRDESVYEQFHSCETSPYSYQEKLAYIIKPYFDQNDNQSIKSILSQGEAYRFIIDVIESQSHISKILEIGCSKGYLTSYFISKGYDILGVDLASTAIETAKRLFGAHFATAQTSTMTERGPYDAIFHVGTIGCVDSPIAFTHECISLLRPGGILVFNAPNVAVCYEQNIIWVKGTSPPDLVTLFRHDFWEKYFRNYVQTKTYCEKVSDVHLLKLFVEDRFRRSPKKQLTRSLFRNSSMTSQSTTKVAEDSKGNFFFSAIRALAVGIFRSSKLAKLLPSYHSDFGVYVVMTRMEQNRGL